MLIANGIGMLSPIVLKETIDNLKNGCEPSLIWRFASLIIYLSIGSGICHFTMRMIIAGTSRSVEMDIRNEFFKQLQFLPPSYYDSTQTGDVMTRGVSDISHVRSLLGPGIIQSFNIVISLTIGIVLMMSISPFMTILCMFPFPFTTLITWKYLKIHNKQARDRQGQLDIVTRKIQESLAGIRVIKSYCREDNFLQSYKDSVDSYNSYSLKLVRTSSFYNQLLGLIVSLSFVIILWFGGRGVIKGDLSLGEYVALNSYLGMLLWPMMQAGRVLSMFEIGSASMARIKEVLDEAPEVKNDYRTNYNISAIDGDIKIRNLTFAYNKNTANVLNNISCDIPKNKITAIVGRTGCGKSTIARLLLRLYQAPDNSIFIDGKDINAIPLEILRKHIGYVAQDIFLFSDSIKSNITFGKPEAKIEEIQHAIDIAELSKDISALPDGLNTYLGERGVTLSGGQKQRTSISRALLINPTVLLLDDCFSSVDTHTEEAIWSKLVSKLHGITCLIIAHRISTIKNADQIIVLDKGAVIEVGEHKQLLENDKLYAEIYRKQLWEDEIKTM